MNVIDAIKALLDYGIARNLITADDEICARNQLMNVLHASQWETPTPTEKLPLEEILTALVDHAILQGIIEDTTSARDRFDTKLMGILTPMPREVISKFKEVYEKSPEAATDWYYQFSKDTDYVRAARIAKDLHWVYESEYGSLDITINRSKTRATLPRRNLPPKFPTLPANSASKIQASPALFPTRHARTFARFR